MREEVLVFKKKRDKMNVKIVEKRFNSWSPSNYEKVLANKDFNSLALLFHDLNSMGYNIRKAYTRFLELSDEPELFFLK